ncbi:MAG: MarR family transcriptional regulator [Ktedonobacteraceae bacterium]|nr:MarR family transcriptional regulator [Ktedonobacteraceae bacterium]MBO0790705.1 MarR family transcriptional regulator [Ktedonobacteraceae bacterium]
MPEKLELSEQPETEGRQGIDALANALLKLVPKLLRRMRADVPLLDIEKAVNGDVPDLLAVSELRATPGQLSLLQYLVERERCTMQELAEHMTVVPSTVTAMVKRLLAQGYVERKRDDEDWRAVWVSATERGRRIVSAYDSAGCQALQRRLERLSPQERRQLSDALPALCRLIDS